MFQSPLETLFNPTGIAVFGASESTTSVGSKVHANLLAGGFKGPIVPINPKHKKVRGQACYASVIDVPDKIDLAVIATPARTIPGIIHDLGEVGVGSAIVLSAGFREAGEEGQRLEKKLAKAARKAGVRFMGPNCVGLVRPWLGMNATFLNSSAPEGRLALVSQSGALCSAIVDYAAPHHLGFSTIASLGNASDVNFGEALHFLATDPKTDAILLYVEGISNAPGFLSALRIAARSKPVIVLKSGRHVASSKAANTHTGAMIGSDSVFDAALSRSGAVRANTFGQLFAAAEILSAHKRTTGKRLGIVTNGGGAGVLAADRAGDFGLQIPEPSEATIKSLDAILPLYWSRANPVDILGDASAKTYGAAVKACLADKSLDGVLVMLTPQAMTDAKAAAQAVVDVVPARNKKPVLACWMGETSVAEGRKLLSAAGIPDFGTPERAVEAFSYLAQHHRHQRLALEVPGPLGDVSPPDLTGARMIIDGALRDGRSMLNDIESKAILRTFHIPTNMTIEAESAAEALVAAETVGFPVAMKILSPQISHKSDVDGVKLGLMNPADVMSAFREITETAAEMRPDAEIRGVTVERMAQVNDARELVVGASRDPVFGPVIMFGAGGTMVEILQDSAVALPPLNAVLATRLIDRTRVSRLLEAFRDRHAVKREAVVDVLLRVSDMVCELPEIEELDLNPIFAGPEGVIAVDARIAIKRPPSKDGAYDHMAIHPYPRHLVRKSHMSDGRILTIRPIRPEDAEEERSFVRELSPRAKRFRFMGTISELSPQMLARFTQIDYRTEMALVAMVEQDGKQTQIGVTRYAINPDRRSCEFAIVVSDAVQHQGIGTKLMKALMEAARDHGLAVIEGTVLRENDAMLHLMEELGFSISTSPDDREVVIVERDL
ncbi:bifunctional acetate--CoA ligase family protein/GNAT family N-acetyltransferase [Alisedimentitalea sp. MJ-SS2]|uniref:bifunctional acetate--CoA ligase family protein/GNAT family N-acetyltransferase n=1 Tax=Aliisedimentitalea sp. MJ-SS2 TaxID=3049795 RepID=UPI002912CC2E|nr:bifunctional acetate--CoA ligase family protein/GNAT family N-acetyltransferase [Alisedimentitalea sp. MJ-SS2]MDU8927489.1 bifunctional acetate--CoA ligase family protein/GNAT family N-acetyltransferase [Alisedimentitalea sp. MJ-SS2]